MFPLSAPLRQSFPVLSLPARRLADILHGIAARLRARQACARARRELRELDDATLRDIGLARAQANFDADGPFRRE